MLDTDKADGWANNVNNNNRQNPDLYAIVATVIALRNRDDRKYAVSPEGHVSRI